MAWNDIIGQTRVKSLLERLWESGRMPHAMLFHGPAGSGKDAIAIELARTLNCERGAWEPCGVCQSCARMAALRHPRFRMVFALPSKPQEKTPTDKFSDAEMEEFNRQIELKAENPYHRFAMGKAAGIKISSIRDVKQESAFRGARGGRTVVLISEAERMNDSAANALLKTLEEPTGDLLLILTTSKRDALLPTILSRCQQIRFDLLHLNELRDGLQRLFDIPEEKAAHAALLANGSVAEALELSSEEMLIPRPEIYEYLKDVYKGAPTQLMKRVKKYAEVEDKKALALFLNGVAGWFRDVLVVHEGAPERIRSTDLRVPIEKFAASFPDARCEEAVEAIETTIEMIQKNVHLVTALIVVSHRSRRCMTPGA